MPYRNHPTYCHGSDTRNKVELAPDAEGVIYVLRRAKDAKERAKYRRDYNLFRGIFANYAALTAQKGTAISKESREKEVEWKQLSLADLEVRLGEVAQQVTKLVEQKPFAFDEKPVPFLPLSVKHFFTEEYWYNNCGVSSMFSFLILLTFSVCR